MLSLDSMVTFREMLDSLLGNNTMVAPNEIPNLMDKSLSAVGQFFNCDRSYVFQFSDDLLTRAADVILKERRKLIIVPRDTPFSLIHINNMKTITEAGGIISPACPSFYSRPQTIEEVAATVVDRLIDLAGIQQTTYRWSE